MPTVLYVCGADRSGSTLLSTLLGRCGPVVAVGEMARYLWERGAVRNETCGCGVPFGHCGFWQAVLARVSGGGEPPDARALAAMRTVLEGHRCLPIHVFRYGGLRRRARVELRAYSESVKRVLDALEKESGAELVVDSSKIPVYGWILNQIQGAGVHVLHLVRDSRAVAYSFQRAKIRPGTGDRAQPMRRRKPGDAARYWLRLNLAANLFRFARIPYLRVRYEDLVADVPGTLAAILEFAGVREARKRVSHADRARTIHTVSGNPARFDTAAEVRLDAAWRTALPDRDFRTVTALTLPLLGAYGYPFRRQ